MFLFQKIFLIRIIHCYVIFETIKGVPSAYWARRNVTGLTNKFEKTIIKLIKKKHLFHISCKSQFKQKEFSKNACAILILSYHKCTYHSLSCFEKIYNSM